MPPALEGKVLTTGLPGKSYEENFFFFLIGFPDFLNYKL